MWLVVSGKAVIGLKYKPQWLWLVLKGTAVGLKVSVRRLSPVAAFCFLVCITSPNKRFLLRMLVNMSISVYIITSILCKCLAQIYMCVYHVHVWNLQRSEKYFGSPAIWITNSCKPLNRFWEPNLGHILKQQVFLTRDPFLHPPQGKFSCLLFII